MYTSTQLLKGIKNPTLAKCEVEKNWQMLKSYFPHDVGVQGSYWTTNIGDRSIGKIIVNRLDDGGLTSRMIPKHVAHSNSLIQILGGGGVIHDFYGTSHLRRRLNFLDDHGVIMGVGVPGVRSTEARNLLREKLTNVEFISVRDERSRRQLQPLYDGDIKKTACPALLHEDPNSPLIGRTGVNFLSTFSHGAEIMSYYFGYEPDIDIEKAKRKYLDNIKTICSELNDPVYIPFHINDEKFAKKHLDIDILPYNTSVNQTLKRVSSVDRMVTMRYHSLIFSIICQKPVLVINYSPKVESLAKRVQVPCYKPHEDIPLKFESIKKRDKLMNSAEENFRLLNGVIHRVGL